MNGVIKCNAGRVTANGVKWSYLPDGDCAHDLWWVEVLRKTFQVMAWRSSLGDSLGPDPSTLPPKPGTAPIPDGAVRLYHYSREENIPSLINNGILKQKAVGETYGEPNMVWASAQQPGPEVPYVEFYAYGEELDIGRGSGRGGAFAEGEVEWMEGRGSNVTLLGDVPPERIVSYHEPWIDAVRYLEDGSVDAVLAGEYDYIGDNLPREKRAIDWIKGHYRAPDTSGVSV